MLDPISAITGVAITGVNVSTLYAAYLRGARDATDPAHVVGLHGVGNYHAESARAETVGESVEAATDGS